MSVAKSYAKALYEVARDESSVETQLEVFLKILDDSRELRVALFGPVSTAKEKAAITTSIAKQLGFSVLTTRFLALLGRKRRLSLLREIKDAFVEVRLAAEGGILGKLDVADNLDEAEVNGLAKAFGHKLGKKVVFNVSKDPALLAGMKVTVNGVTYDGTLRSQLQRLRDRLVQPPSLGE